MSEEEPAKEPTEESSPTSTSPDQDYGLDDHQFNIEANEYLQTITCEDEELEEGEKPFSYFDLLDQPRILPQPSLLTLEHLKQISYELGLIKLCWPEITDPLFEDRVNFPESYLKNSNKEKLLLLYTENFRQQFAYKYPDRRPLFLACENECGMQKMVCTTIRPTTIVYKELQSWEEVVSFVADHLKYEPLEEPTLIGDFYKTNRLRVAERFLSSRVPTRRIVKVKNALSNTIGRHFFPSTHL